MKGKIITTIVFIFTFSLSSYGQIDKRFQWEVNALALQTPAVDIYYLYDGPVNYPGVGLSSETTRGFALQGRAIRPLSKKLHLILGTSAGFYAYHTRADFTEEFTQLASWSYSPYGLYFDWSRYEVFWASAITGLRLPVFSKNRSSLNVDFGFRVNYNRMLPGRLTRSKTLNSGEEQWYYTVFTEGLYQNRFILSPEIGLVFQQYLKNDKLGFNIGGNFIYSNRDYVIGEFVLVGDTESIPGTYAQKFRMIGLTAGVVWKLDKNK